MMPVISAYSSSSYISPSSSSSSYRFKSSLPDRRSYTTSITSSGTAGSSFYRRSSYRYDLPSSTSAYSSSYRSSAAATTSTTSSSATSDRAADTELSNSLSTLATSSEASNGTKEVASRPSRYSSAYGSYGSSRVSSRSSDGARTLKDRENNCYCAGGAGSSSSYATSLRNTALSGADIYSKYSVSTYSRPSIYERIAASRPVEKPTAASVVSIASPASLDSSKVKTIPAKDRNSNCLNVSAQNNNPTNTTSNGTSTLTHTSSSVVNPLLDATNGSLSSTSAGKPGVKPASAACFSVRSETCAASNTITHTTTTTTTTTLSSSSSSSALHDHSSSAAAAAPVGRVRRTAATFQQPKPLRPPPVVPPKLSTYRNQNFLKHECDLVKRELSKSATELAFRKTTATAAPPPPKVKQFLPPVVLPAAGQPKDHEDDDKPQSHHHSHPKHNGHQLTASIPPKHHQTKPSPSPSTGAAVQNDAVAAAELKPNDRFEPVTQKNDTFLFKPSTSCSTTTTTTTTTPTTKPSESLTIASYQPTTTSTTRTESCTYPTPSRSAMKSLHITSELEESITQATIKLRPSLNGTASTTNGGNSSSTTAKFVATATPATAEEDPHVTVTIRLKPKSSIIQHSSTSSSSSSSSTSNNNNGIDGSASSGNSSSDEQDARYRNGNGAKAGSNNNNNNEDGAEESDEEPDKPEVQDKDSKRQPAADEEKVSYLRAGTASKSIHSTSPVGYRSGRDWDSGITASGASSSSNNGTSSGGYRSGLKSSGYGQDGEDSSRSGGSRKDGLCGLWNIGNTCFMNSVIQCLSHTRELTAYLRKESTTERGTSKDHKILAEYTKLIKDMWSGNTRSVNPSELKYAFSSKHRMYSGSAQQDAQEFLRFFIDSLHSGLNACVKREPMPKEIEDDDLPNRVKSSMMWDWYSRVENSVIKDLFVGMLRSTLRCSACNNASVTFDPFWDLSLPLPSTNSRGKLLDCMDEFVREEVMDGLDQVYCSKCKARRKCTKSMAIERFPKYLVIHLKRFSETRWSKLTNVIEFPTGERELNLQQYASEDHQGPVNYSLYGISNHMGSTAGGHYIAVCKHPVSKEWNEFNDNFVSDASERSLVTSSAYVLFYERA